VPAIPEVQLQGPLPWAVALPDTELHITWNNGARRVRVWNLQPWLQLDAPPATALGSQPSRASHGRSSHVLGRPAGFPEAGGDRQPNCGRPTPQEVDAIVLGSDDLRMAPEVVIRLEEACQDEHLDPDSTERVSDSPGGASSSATMTFEPAVDVEEISSLLHKISSVQTLPETEEQVPLRSSVPQRPFLWIQTQTTSTQMLPLQNSAGHE